MCPCVCPVGLTPLVFCLFPFQAKVSNGGQVGLGYSQNLRDGVKLTLSALIEGKTLNQGGHKLGVALDFDA